jgi:capsular polysaccharide biosynthesis protein
MKSDQVHFAVVFKSKNKNVAQKIVQQASKVIQKQHPEVKRDGVLKIQHTAKQNIKARLIGLVVGFFGGAGIIFLVAPCRDEN